MVAVHPDHGIIGEVPIASSSAKPSLMNLRQ